MTEYGQAFYGSDEIHARLGEQIGECKLAGSQIWLNIGTVTFKNPSVLYRLPVGHWFYGSDEFKRAKKLTLLDKFTKPLADYSEDELQNKIKSMQSEIDRRKAQEGKITILARQLCADNYNYPGSGIGTDFTTGKRDDTPVMHIAKASIIAGMELQKGR